jgi:hypothetical protein
MKMGVLVLLVALLPIATSAQVPIPRAASPAQLGISVSGQGAIRYSLKSLRFAAFARGNLDEAAVLAALRTWGIDDPTIGPAQSNIGPNASTIVRGVIRDVSRAKLERLGIAATEFARAHPGTTIENVSFQAPAAECAAHEEAARAMAIGAARRKADAIATLAGLSIDGIGAVNESGGCPIDVEPGFGPSGQVDLATLTTAVTVNEYVMFTVSPATGAPRRRML